MNNQNSARKNASKSKESRPLTIIGNKFRVFDVVGKGNFGTVKRGVDKDDPNFQVAVKIELITKKTSQLKMEMHFYKILGKHPGIPVVYGFYEEDTFNALVMQLLYKDLYTLYMMSNQIFSPMTHHLVALKILELLEYIHSRNLIFRDMKPENFMVGCPPNDDNQLYMIDFGLSKEYVDPKSGSHIEFRAGKKPSGTPRYMSLNSHREHIQSRRDDIESLCYMLIFFQKQSLPWQGLNAPTPNQKYQKITEKKESTTVDELCENLTPHMKEMLEYSRSLDFYEDPDYPHLKGMFEKSILEIEPNRDKWKFDWVKTTPKNTKVGGSTSSNLDPGYQRGGGDACTSFSHNADGDCFSSTLDDYKTVMSTQCSRKPQVRSDISRNHSSKPSHAQDTNNYGSNDATHSAVRNGGSIPIPSQNCATDINNGEITLQKVSEMRNAASPDGAPVKKRKGFVTKFLSLFSSIRKPNRK